MKSIKLKIMLGLFLAVTVPMVLVFGFLFRAFYDQTLEQRIEAVTREINQLDNAMTIFMDQAKDNVTLLAGSPLLRRVDASLTSYVATKEKTKAIPREDDAAGKAIMAYYQEVQNSHPPYVEVYFGSEEGGFVSSLDGPIPAGYDPRKRPWYLDALAAPDRPVISKAYMSTSGEAVVGVTKVASEGGKRLGAVGVDISLTVLTDIVKAIKIGRSGYVVFVQGDGVVISNPRDAGQNFKKIAELGVAGLKQAFDLGRGHVVVEMGGERFLALCHDAPKLGWKFLTFVSEDEVVGPVRALMWRSALAVGAILLLIGGFISFFLNKEIFRPLTRIIGQLRAVGQGRYDERLTVRRRDEVGEVCEALNQTTQTLAASVGEIEKRRVEAERTAREAGEARLQAEEARSRAESARIEGMLHAADRLKGVAGVVSTASGELSAQIEEASLGAGHQSGRIDETATAVEEMSASVLEIARNAGSAAALADRTRAAAADGKAQMEKVKTDAHGIHDGFQEVYASVSDLSAKADGIGSIARTIEDIADQTNLLALNAAIEAARAGEAGRGFAVVADEVRKLAEKTMVATKEVESRIRAIQDAAGRNIKSMDQAVSAVAEANTLAEQSGQAIAAIVGHADATSSQIQAIAASAEEQSAASEQISRA
ncbi:methyl-accepting chemotaxis protein, partial [Solidesulfovibrio sp.]|uniref:methyl-accepting chemotaxis protein n=1 Tax=Solidesulfovibrio sp. TaxID=2910990 RepID=UPI00261E5D51